MYNLVGLQSKSSNMVQVPRGTDSILDGKRQGCPRRGRMGMKIVRDAIQVMQGSRRA